MFKYFANEKKIHWGVLGVSEDVWRFVQTLCITDYYGLSWIGFSV